MMSPGKGSGGGWSQSHSAREQSIFLVRPRICSPSNRSAYSRTYAWQIDPLLRLSMACPALPMCGLAITEAERRLPTYIDRIRVMMNR